MYLSQPFNPTFIEMVVLILLSGGFCNEAEFDCNNNALCVAHDAECNGFNDCLDYQDEASCGKISHHTQVETAM